MFTTDCTLPLRERLNFSGSSYPLSVLSIGDPVGQSVTTFAPGTSGLGSRKVAGFCSCASTTDLLIGSTIRRNIIDAAAMTNFARPPMTPLRNELIHQSITSPSRHSKAEHHRPADTSSRQRSRDVPKHIACCGPAARSAHARDIHLAWHRPAR